MATKHSIYCDYCNKKVTDDDKQLERINGFCLELGYSEGGWGSRRDFVPKQSVEICDVCFSEIKEVVIKLKNKIQELKLKKY